MIQKNVVPLHPQLRNNMLEIAMILGYGVMVTLQILVLSFLVRVRVSQLLHHCHQSSTCTLGYGVMVTLQILVLSFLVRVRVSQLLHHCHQSSTCTLGYGVMVTLQILVLSFLVRVRVSQLESIFHFERCFFRIFTFWRLRENFAFYYVLQKKRGCVVEL